MYAPLKERRVSSTSPIQRAAARTTLDTKLPGIPLIPGESSDTNAVFSSDWPTVRSTFSGFQTGINYKFYTNRDYDRYQSQLDAHLDARDRYDEWAEERASWGPRSRRNFHSPAPRIPPMPQKPEAARQQCRLAGAPAPRTPRGYTCETSVRSQYHCAEPHALSNTLAPLKRISRQNTELVIADSFQFAETTQDGRILPTCDVCSQWVDPASLAIRPNIMNAIKADILWIRQSAQGQ